MSNFLNKFKSEINKGVNVVSVKSKGLIEVTKINSQINGLQAQRRIAFEDLGSTVYNMFENTDMDMEKINSMCKEISLITANIEEKKEQIKKIQEDEQETINKYKPATCECGEVIKEDSLFCSKCGNKIEVEKPLEVENDLDNKCECGAEIKIGSKFCSKCGKKIESQE